MNENIFWIFSILFIEISIAFNCQLKKKKQKSKYPRLLRETPNKTQYETLFQFNLFNMYVRMETH